MPRGKPKRQLSVRIDAELADRIDREQGSPTEVIERALRAYFDPAAFVARGGRPSDLAPRREQQLEHDRRTTGRTMSSSDAKRGVKPIT